MTKKLERLAQVQLTAQPFSAAYLGTLFGRLKAQGFTGVFLGYGESFPYDSCPQVRQKLTYSQADIKAIDDAAGAAQLELVPNGLSFSHSSAILKQDAYKHLADTPASLDLTKAESRDLMIRSGEDILRLHPRTRTIHFGGDEIYGLGSKLHIRRRIDERGRSGLYVDFVNQLAGHFAARGVRVAIWSDMLIRYPQAVDELDKSVIIYYWDYWSSGERTPFVSIGGGASDIFMLDSSQLTGDLKKMLRHPGVRPAEEIPIGHVRTFERYWQLAADGRSVRSFPYEAWLKDHGFTVISALMTYPEKGSFLPHTAEKLDHIRWFLRRTREAAGDGFLACHWQADWPFIETCWPGLLATQELADHPDIDDDAVCEGVARRLGTPWSGQTVRGYFSAGRDFEFADTLNAIWMKVELRERLYWLDAMGVTDEDMAVARQSLADIESLLANWKSLQADAYERFVLDDMAWRARVQLACQADRKAACLDLLPQGQALEARCRSFVQAWHPPGVAAEVIKTRYEPWFQALAAPEKKG